MKTKTLYIIIIILILSVNFAPVHAQDVVSDLLGRINNLRANLGLDAYTLQPSLMAAAQSHAQWMADTSSVTHVQDNGSRPVDRAQANGYNSSWVSENIYMGGIATVDDAWNFWINSEIHYAGLTSVNYDHIGIGTAQGAGGQSFVLVFGNSGSPRNLGGDAASSNSNANRANAPAAPPPAIKGNDEFGNIQYELQAGDTLGDVLLLFGYTWEALPTLMALNSLSDADISNLEIGQIILVPPVEGTWTPTPEITAEATEPAPESTESLSENGVTSDEDSETLLEPVTFNGENLDDETLAQPATFVSMTATPLPSPIATQAVLISTPILAPLGIIPTPVPEKAVEAAQMTNPPAWLVGAIVAQVGVLIYAAYELIKRWRG